MKTTKNRDVTIYDDYKNDRFTDTLHAVNLKCTREQLIRAVDDLATRHYDSLNDLMTAVHKPKEETIDNGN